MGYKPYYDKLNVASIGCGGQGGRILNQAARTENIVALCDVDEKRAAQNFETYSKQPKYEDFRIMLDKEGKNIDACTIGIPDHMHATVALAVHAGGQARLSRKAADAHAMGSAIDGRRRQEVRRRDADGQPGLLARE